MDTKTVVNALWLYDDLLDLYGDWGNLLVLKSYFGKMNIEFNIIKKSIGDDFDLEVADFVYIGPGKFKNLCAASRDILRYKDDIKTAIESGKCFLVTGNARLMFGNSFEDTGKNLYEGLGIFDYTGHESGNVKISDVVAFPVYSETPIKSYGFINRTSYIEGNRGDYMFNVIKGFGDVDAVCESEGNIYRNFFSTWLLGPLLAKNPHLAIELMKRILQAEAIEVDTSLADKALELTLLDKNLQ